MKADTGLSPHGDWNRQVPRLISRAVNSICTRHSRGTCSRDVGFGLAAARLIPQRLLIEPEHDRLIHNSHEGNPVENSRIFLSRSTVEDLAVGNDSPEGLCVTVPCRATIPWKEVGVALIVKYDRQRSISICSGMKVRG